MAPNKDESSLQLRMSAPKHQICDLLIDIARTTLKDSEEEADICGFCDTMHHLSDNDRENVAYLCGMHMFFSLSFMDGIRGYESEVKSLAQGRDVVRNVVSKINAAFTDSNCSIMFICFDSGSPPEKHMTQSKRSTDIEPYEWDGESPIILEHVEVPNWKRLLANRPARYRAIEELFDLVAISPHLHRDPHHVIFVDMPGKLLEIGVSGPIVHPAVHTEESDFGIIKSLKLLHSWKPSLGYLRMHQPQVKYLMASIPDTDAVTSMIQCHDFDFVKPVDITILLAKRFEKDGDEQKKHRYISFTPLIRNLKRALGQRSIDDLLATALFGGGDYCSKLQRTSYKNLFSALLEMPAELNLCEHGTGADGNTLITGLNRKAFFWLYTKAYVDGINSRRRNNKIECDDLGTNPLRRGYAIVSGAGSDQQIASNVHSVRIFERHLRTVLWYVTYIYHSCLGRALFEQMPMPCGLKFGGWTLEKGDRIYAKAKTLTEALAQSDLLCNETLWVHHSS